MDDLLAFVETREQEVLSLLESLVNVDSGTHDKAGVDRMSQVLSARLEALGFAVERVPQTQYGDHLLARKAGSGKQKLLFIGHMDTVFPQGTAAARPFKTDSVRAYGPGVADMKGGLVCLIYALAALRAAHPTVYDELAMTVLLNSEEEILSPTSRPTIEAEARRADAVCVFEPARPGGECVVARKGVGKYWLKVRGRAAHAGSQPELGRSAILEMAHKTVALHGLTDFDTGVTVNVGVVRGGERSNVVAEEATAEIDLRAPTRADADRADRAIRAIADAATLHGTSAEITGGLFFPPMEQSDGSRRLFRLWREAGADLGLDLKGVSTGGGSDGNHTSQFAPTLDGMGPVGSDAHSDREHMDIASLFERIKVTALFLARLGGRDT
jgi:glutamate carboxypeptidase